MKKYLSVFMLTARNSLFKILAIFGANVIMQVIAYIVLVKRQIQVLGANLDRVGIEYSFETGKTPLVCAVCFVLICIYLAKTGCEFSAKTGYTINRLSVSEKKFFLIQSVYNLAVLTVFYVLNLAIAFLLIKLYLSFKPIPAVTNQSIFIAFYRSNYLHSLLPLSDVLRFAANCVNTVALALLLSVFSFKQRRGKWSIAALCFTAFTVSSFLRETGSINADCTVMAIGLWLIVKTLIDVFAKEVSDDGQV